MTRNPRNNPYYRLSNIYRGIKTRCYNPKRKDYKNYGGRGIIICDEWLISDHKTHKGWEAFKEWSLKNGYTDEMTIDRIDNNKGYSPDNCRWVNIKIQANNKRNNRVIKYKGKTQTLSQWAEEIGIKQTVLSSRVTKCKLPLDKIFKKENLKLRKITYQNKTQSLKEWCKELGLNYSRVHSRIVKYHWTVEKTFEYKENATMRMVTYKGKTQSIADWCKELNLNYNRVVGRLDHSKWTVEEAFEK